MNRRYRKTIIAGNWKMNNTIDETKALIEGIKAGFPKSKWCGVVIAPTTINLIPALKAVKGTRIAVSAQNIHFEKNGAYTGEISAEMVKAVGCKYVIIGHSERRQYFGETDYTVNLKAKAAIAAGLNPIICVGETLEQREMGVTFDIVSQQVKIALNGISEEQIKSVVIAYEPVWAIGTGKTATAEDANTVCASIRDVVRQLYKARIARAMTIQYGGSMNAKNAAELLAQPDIDGGLIGGASLKADDFLAIIQAANQ